MEVIADIFILLLAIILSSAFARLTPIPLPLSQIAIGFALASIFHLHIDLDPNLFFLLFLPPLLFLDGWRIPKEELFYDKRIILRLAFGLVFATVFVLGFFINAMMPAIPLAVAFALAASLSPTDAVAVSAIVSKTPAPQRLVRILEGESLLNDASGLVAMRFAVIAAMTGTFSLSNAVGDFLWMAFGGFGIGVLATIAIMRSQNFLANRLGEEPSVEILISLLTPFGAYGLAEYLGASAIMAAVAAGISMSYLEQTMPMLAATRLRRDVIWDIIQFTINGVIFVLLGFQLPKIAVSLGAASSEAPVRAVFSYIGYAIAIGLVLTLLRFIWIYVAVRFKKFKAKRRLIKYEPPGLRIMTALSLAGVRGATSLAGIMSLPLALSSGAPFPAREIVIFLAANVILCSLALASAGLPIALKGLKLPAQNPRLLREASARAQAAECAIHAIENYQKGFPQTAPNYSVIAQTCLSVSSFYRRRIAGYHEVSEQTDQPADNMQFERDICLVGLKAERDAYYKMGRTHKISDDVVRKLVHETDLMESRLSSS